jgi:hypothetical protein
LSALGDPADTNDTLSIAEQAMHQIQPTVGQWYLRPGSGLKFEVIDIDDGDGVIEIQDEEGTLDQVDAATWFEVAVELTDQPQDISPAFDNLAEPDDADGGDPVDMDASNSKLQRVATSEMLDDSDRYNDDLGREDETPAVR